MSSRHVPLVRVDGKFKDWGGESLGMMESDMEETREDWKRRKMTENGLNGTGRDGERGKMCVCSACVYWVPFIIIAVKINEPLRYGRRDGVHGDRVAVLVGEGTYNWVDSGKYYEFRKNQLIYLYNIARDGHNT